MYCVYKTETSVFDVGSRVKKEYSGYKETHCYMHRESSPVQNVLEVYFYITYISASKYFTLQYYEPVLYTIITAQAQVHILLVQ